MSKLLPDHRVIFGTFEVIDFPDEERIAPIRQRLDVDVPMHVRWNDWEYGSEIQELRRLYEKGKRSQWNASEDLNWDTPVTKDEWLGDPQMSIMGTITKLMGKDEATQKAALFDEVNWIVSQLLHGEQAALQICGQLTNLCPTTDEKFYAANQANDEARHCEVFARFVGEKMGTIYPVSPVVKTLLDEILAAEGYEKKALGMQTLFEGFAMGLMDLLREALTNPLARDMLRRVEIDEARHAAFGVLTMRRLTRQVDPEVKRELEDWSMDLLETLNANQNMSMLRTLGPKYGINATAVTQAMLADRAWVEGNSMVYMHTVMPNLVRLGLVTERTEDRYRKLGMLTDMRRAAQGPVQPDLQ